MKELHTESLEEAVTHSTDEARMVLPGVQAILGFQLIAVFNQKFEQLPPAYQHLHLAAFVLLALAMGMLMAPAAYHRQVERGMVSRTFLDIASTLLTLAMLPLLAGLAFDTFILACLVTKHTLASILIAVGLSMALAVCGFCFLAWPDVVKRRLRRDCHPKPDAMRGYVDDLLSDFFYEKRRS